MTTASEAGSEPIVWRLRLAASPERVHAAWLSCEDHARFWCERSEPLPAGFRQQFVGGEVGECEIESSTPPFEIVFRYFGSRVTLRFESLDGGTDLTLTARDVPAYDWHDVHTGWLNVLLPFKAWVDFGVDLRNHDPSRSWRQRYVDQ